MSMPPKEIYGTFDGENMIDENGRHYPVPGNYASKSMLLEGDGLKLTITEGGDYYFKQASPQPFQRAMAKVLSVTDDGAYALLNGKQYRILLKTATHFKLLPEMQISIRFPKNIASSWVTVEGVIK